MQQRLTKSWIDKIAVEKRTRYTDTQVPQLTLRANPNGKHAFYYRARHRAAGLIERKIGPVGQWTLDQAREEAVRLAADFNQGIDPHEKDKEEEHNRITINQLIDQFLEWTERRLQQGQIKLNTRKGYQREAKRIRAGIGTRRVTEITTRELRNFLLQQTVAPGTENQTIVALRYLFRYAKDQLEISIDNPATDLKMNRTQPRDRYLQTDEVGRFFDALALEDEHWQHLALILIFTGQRKMSVYQMEWKEIDMERRTWNIPASKSKTSKPIVVALADEAIAILEARHRKRISTFVFPSIRDSSKPQPEKTFYWWTRITKRAGIEGLTIHDLRRTLATWQAREGVSIHQISRSLGHANISTTARTYAHIDAEGTRPGIQTAIEAMNRIVGKTAPADPLDALVEGLTLEQREALLNRLRSVDS